MSSSAIYQTATAAWNRMGSQPGLTWFTQDSERIELSAKVLDNWVIKSANMLYSEFDLGLGDTLGMHTSIHWRSMVLTLAAWQRGACVSFYPPSEPPNGELPNVLVSSHIAKLKSHHMNKTDLVALHCASLSRQYPGDLPPLTLDANAATMTYPDDLIDRLDVPAETPAVKQPTLDHGEFLTTALRAYPQPPARTLVHQSTLTLLQTLQVAVATWHAGHALVLLDPEIDWSATQIASITASEQATRIDISQ